MGLLKLKGGTGIKDKNSSFVKSMFSYKSQSRSSNLLGLKNTDLRQIKKQEFENKKKNVVTLFNQHGKKEVI